MPDSTSTSAATALPDRSWSTPARAYAPSTGSIQAERAAVSSAGSAQGERHGVVGDPVRPARDLLVHRAHELLRRLRAGGARHEPGQPVRAVHLAGAPRLDQAVGVREHEVALLELQLGPRV